MDTSIFNHDAFSLSSLTAAINEAPALPSRIRRLGLFEEEGLLTTSFTVEKDVDTLALIPNQSRSATPVRTGGGTRSMRTFSTTHLPTQDIITADDIQNLRAFGMASEVETMRAFVDRRPLGARAAEHRRGDFDGVADDGGGVGGVGQVARRRVTAPVAVLAGVGRAHHPADRHRAGAPGLFGGLDGRTARLTRDHGTPEETELSSKISKEACFLKP